MAFEPRPLPLTPISVQLVEALLQTGIPKNTGVPLPITPSQRALFVGGIGLHCFQCSALNDLLLSKQVQGKCSQDVRGSLFHSAHNCRMEMLPGQSMLECWSPHHSFLGLKGSGSTSAEMSLEDLRLPLTRLSARSGSVCHSENLPCLHPSSQSPGLEILPQRRSSAYNK